MKAGLDSAFPPTLSEAKAAYAKGVRVWGGYFPGHGIYHGWEDSHFQMLRQVGIAPIAYCSGYSDPHEVRVHAQSLGIRACLDVEAGIRGFGAWTPGWISSGQVVGLYGNGPVHSTKAPFHVLAGYPGGYVPPATWHLPYHSPVPPTPHAWQWKGTHAEYNVGVDSSWFDDWFEEDQMTQQEITDLVQALINKNDAAVLEGVQARCAGKDRPGDDQPRPQYGWDTADSILKTFAPGTPWPHTHDQADKTGGVSS